MRRALAAALLPAAVVFACGGSARAPGPPVATEPAQPTVEEKTDAGQPRIELLDLGAEPRRPLRLAPAAGSPAGADVVMTMNTRVGQDAEGSAINLSFGWTGRVTSAGDPIRVDGRFDELVVDGEAAEHGQVAFTYTLLPTAALTAFDVLAEAPPPMDAMLAESVRQMMAWLVVFPTTPVGAGARWRIQTDYVQNGIPVTMIVTSELASRDGTRASIRGEMEFRSAPDQPAFIEGTGRIVADFDLTRVVPRAELVLRFTGEVKTDEVMTMSGDSMMTLSPRP